MNPNSSLSPSTGPQRLHGLDAVRGLALLLGVLLHACMSFMPGAQFFWIVADNDPAAASSLAFYAIHCFRMLLFFLIAGLFARMGLERLGLRAFLRDRGRRIALPLLVGWPIVFAAIVAVVVWASWIRHGGQLPEQSPPGPAFTPDDFPLTHLWFLYVLLLAYAVALPLRGLCRRIDPAGQLAASGDRLLARLLPVLPVLMALPLAASLGLHDGWYAWFGIPTPDRSLYPNLPAIVGFGSAFAVGWLLQRRMDLLSRLQAQWPMHLGMAIIAIAIALQLIGPTSPPFPAARNASTFAYAWAYAVAGWSACFVLIGLGLRYASGYSLARRYLADASYWIYLAHLPVVMALQVLVARIEAPWFLKLPAVVLVALLVLLGSYQLLVRYTWLGALLSGRRRQRGRRPTAPAEETGPSAMGSMQPVPGP